MVLNFENLVNKYSLNIRGIIHVGAHLGQEYKIYKKFNINNFVFVEPQPDIFQKLKQNIGNDSNVILINKAFGNKTGSIKMYIDSYSQASSSILEPKLHLIRHPHIKFNNEIIVEISKMDDEIKNPESYNFLSMDCQGYELEILRGGIKTLSNIDYIMTEVNKSEVYSGNALIEDVDSFLSKFNFKRVETDWIGGIWGDSFYIKEK